MTKEWFSDHVSVNGIKLHYYRTGGDKPPLVLSHGITDNGLCWTPLARVLEEEYDVIMYDARGHGFSDAPEAGYSYDYLASDLAGLIQQLDLERPRVIGHSLGAATTATAAVNYPDLMRCAVLEDPPWRAESVTAGEEKARGAEWRAEIVERKSMDREQLIALCRAEHPTWPEAARGPWADAKLQVDLSIFGFFSTPRTPWQDIVAGITCPFLLVTADPELGAIVTPEAAREAAGLWQNGEIVRIEGAGHNIRREAFDRYVATVTAFLKRV
jgi:pimeloyl-ACP methyl ester carboxylesterase